jgi:YfiH family protein
MDDCRLYPFSIEDSGGSYARLPLVFERRRLDAPVCLITLRRAGNMAIGEATRERLFASLGIATAAYCLQTHSRVAALVAERTDCTACNADGLVGTGRAVLSVTVADCLPVFLFDTASGCCSVLHSGWKGTGIVINALALMRDAYGTDPRRVAALLGPCIRACCYNVDEARALLFEREAGDGPFPLGPVVRRARRDGRTEHYIDMQAANANLLARSGVRDIAYCVNCTFTDPLLGSFRREGPDGFTKMMALAGNFPLPSAN